MDTGLSGARALVTGGSRGIGLAIVRQLAAEGCNVEFCARNEDQIQIVESELSPAPGSVQGFAVDLEHQEQSLDWAEAAIDRLGGLDILISNASAMATGDSAEAWRRNHAIEIESLSTILSIAREQLEISAKTRGDAAITLLGSTSATSARKRDAYGATKAALVHTMKGLSHELIGKGVRVNMVSPGPVDSKDGIWHQLRARDPKYVERKTSEIPLGRMGKPEEIANIVIFLSSPLARYIVGSNVVADGGRTGHPRH